MSDHTTGPWWYDSHSNVGGLIQGNSEEPGGVASAHHRENPEEFEANAHLIAAAPELLEAAQDVIERMGSKSTNLDRLRAAIAKAEGSGS